ncbi:MAG: molybdopterin dinucleotide binding domain-containing protein [Paracoccaceae bacterium]
MYRSRARQPRRPDRRPRTLADAPPDAAARGLSEGQIVRFSNARGAVLAGLRISDIRPSARCRSPPATPGGTPPRSRWRHLPPGNPNALTPDKGTSKLAQGPIAHSCLVQVSAA